MDECLGMSPEDVQRIEKALFFEPPQMRERLIRFAVLITMASVIASGGLISDSVASVIGAMFAGTEVKPIPPIGDGAACARLLRLSASVEPPSAAIAVAPKEPFRKPRRDSLRCSIRSAMAGLPDGLMVRSLSG